MRYMRGVNNDGFWIAFATVLLVVGLLFGVLAIQAYSCGARWERSGLTSSWGPVQGCLVKLPDGRWLPDDRVREIDINQKAVP